MIDIICLSKVLQATFPYFTVTGYDAHRNNASRPLSIQPMTEKRKSSLRHPNALWPVCPHYLYTRNLANPFGAITTLTAPDDTSRTRLFLLFPTSEKPSPRPSLHRLNAGILACNSAQMDKHIPRCQFIQRAHNHSPKVQPPSFLNLCLASISLRISSSVNRSAPAQFALLVLDLNR